MLPSPPTNPWLRLAARASIALIVPLVAAALLAHIVARPATASHNLPPAPGQASPSAAFEEEEAEAESEDEGWEEEEWEEEEEEAEPSPSNTCPLRTARGHAATKSDTLKLTISYTTTEPFSARITIQRGSVQISSLKRHLGHSGTLRFTEKLGEQGGRKFVANIAASGRSAGCPSRRLVLFPR